MEIKTQESESVKSNAIEEGETRFCEVSIKNRKGRKG